MAVTPIEIANLCAVFAELNTKYIQQYDLIYKIRQSTPIHSSSSADEIIDESINCKVISVDKNSDNLVVTKIGLSIGKKQYSVKNIISPGASKEILTNIYLNIDNKSSSCEEILLKLTVDDDAGTFVYERPKDESKQQLVWLKNLTKVGLIKSSADKFYVCKEYLDLVNIQLSKLREGDYQVFTVGGSENQAVGDLAEELALEYEKQRLINSGYPELLHLIEHTSKIDQSAGYDIKSCCCYPKNPTKLVHIEVKGTKCNRVQFIWSRNERKVAKEKKLYYWIYSYKNVDLERSTADGPFVIKNANKTVKNPSYNLNPIDILVTKNA